ncbi:MAG: hypothetical protein R3E42_15395 [Burkholderiaceae bacterium]
MTTDTEDANQRSLKRKTESPGEIKYALPIEPIASIRQYCINWKFLQTGDIEAQIGFHPDEKRKKRKLPLSTLEAGREEALLATPPAAAAPAA